jgi:hypothetical protein
MSNKQILAAVVGIATVAVAASSPASAAIVANFTDGNTTDSVDGYPGKAGDGWTGPWNSSINTASSVAQATLAASVTSTNAMGTGGNYLSTRITSLAGSGNGRAGLNREFTTFGDVDPTKPHIVQFSVRIDGDSNGDLSEFNTSNNDRLFFFGAPSGMNEINSNNTWLIGALGGSTGGAVAKTFAFYDNPAGGNNSYDPTRFENTGIAIVVGTVYAFTVNVDPAAGTYSASVTDGTNTYASAAGDPLGFRTTTANPATDTLNFALKLSDTNDQLGFSLDNVSVTVPEPSALALAGCIIGVPLMRRRRA